MSTFRGTRTTAAPATARARATTNKTLVADDVNVPQAGNDGISSLNWSPKANILVSSNWDSGIRCWDVQEQMGQPVAVPKLVASHENNSPVLDTCFSSDGGTVFSGGCDKAVRMWDLGGVAPPSNIASQIGIHDAPVKAVGFLPKSNLVVSGGWDKKLKFWDTRSPTPTGVFDMPERVYDLDIRENLMVVATAGRRLIIYNVSGAQPSEHSRIDPSSTKTEKLLDFLKFQTRCVACSPDGKGFCVGSIDGRAFFEYLDPAQKDSSFGWRTGGKKTLDKYSVNSISFSNKYGGTFATADSGGVVKLWDKGACNLLLSLGGWRTANAQHKATD